jgi:HPt (histidine-containing phosphotransfer) domain-containing protein
MNTDPKPDFYLLPHSPLYPLGLDVHDATLKASRGGFSAPVSADRTSSETATARPMGCSRDELLARLGGDEVLMRGMVELFQESAPRVLEAIRAAIAERSATDLARSANRLQGALRAIGADHARHLAVRLEAQAYQEYFQETGGTFADLERNIAEIDEALGGGGAA